ncbi:MAG: DUF1385 domain-containing protein [bacterium]|nr:DUF1385 domain-containing protein [bacterium]MDT8365717.1 DUF1385 domain-containing protein [bacterium]
MMRAPRTMTVAVRKPTGEISVMKETLNLLSDHWAFLKWPVLRGTVSLFGTLLLGIRALNYSAQEALEEDEGEIGPWAMAGTIAAAFALAISLFLLLPLWATRLMETYFHWVAGQWAFNTVDGILRLVVFFLYLGAITMARDIRRVFQYHGAEHMSIYAMEAGEELTVENAKKHSPMHPRCGTSFLLIVMVLSIVVFAQIPQIWPLWAKALARVVLIPLIAGLSYEMLKLGDRYRHVSVFKLILIPGLAMQRLTTRKPTDDQIEVALVALREALAAEEEEGS